MYPSIIKIYALFMSITNVSCVTFLVTTHEFLFFSYLCALCRVYDLSDMPRFAKHTFTVCTLSHWFVNLPTLFTEWLLFGEQPPALPRPITWSLCQISRLWKLIQGVIAVCVNREREELWQYRWHWMFFSLKSKVFQPSCFTSNIGDILSYMPVHVLGFCWQCTLYQL